MNRNVILAMAVIALAASWPAEAGDERKELTPFIGFRFGGEFSDYFTGQTYNVASSEDFGFTFDFPVSDETKLEFLFSRQDTGAAPAL